jgi:hypothetical protein
MKKNEGILVVAISALILIFATESFAQRGMKWKGSGGWGIETQYGRMYDPKTVETIVGEVSRCRKNCPNEGDVLWCIFDREN